jgi:hemopexin
MKATIGKRGILQLVAALALLLCALGPVRGSVQAAASRYFPETDKTVSDPFLSYWTGHGGLSQQGFPITDAQNEVNDADGKTYLTQYFERARFEYHPENNDPKFQVLLGLLGKESLGAKYAGNQPNSPAVTVPGNGSQTFPETGKTVTGMFLDYWNTHGGLEQQGFPITDAYTEVNDADGQTYITQYFERARFEYHPENGDPRFQVLLGLVGREVYGLKQGSSSVAVPPPPWASMKIPTPLDTAFLMPFLGSTDPLDAQALFVKDGVVRTLNLKTGEHTAEDKGIPVQSMFPGLAFTNLTAATAWPAGHPLYGTVFLYYHNVYSIFNLGTHQVVGAMPSNPIDPGSLLIPGPVYPFETYWSYISQSFHDKGPDVAFTLPGSGATKGLIYVCVEGACDEFDAATNQHLDLAGGSYTTLWPGLPFTNDIDAIIPWPNGKLYFFKGDQYAAADIATGKVDPGYPKPIN